MRNSKYGLFAVSGLLVVSSAVWAQDTKAPEGNAAQKKMEMPKPGPEVKKLGYFVGNWKTEGEIKQNPMMPAGKISETASCEWFHGGFSVVCHYNGKSPMGATHELGILRYDTEEKTYTYYGIDNMGYGDLAKGNVKGKNWSYMSDSKMNGQTFHGRYTMTEVSSTEYTFKYEVSQDGQNWSLVMDGKSTKAAGAEKKMESKAPEKKS